MVLDRKVGGFEDKTLEETAARVRLTAGKMWIHFSLQCITKCNKKRLKENQKQ